MKRYRLFEIISTRCANNSKTSKRMRSALDFSRLAAGKFPISLRLIFVCKISFKKARSCKGQPLYQHERVAASRDENGLKGSFSCIKEAIIEGT
jgi:hypothetical protein